MAKKEYYSVYVHSMLENRLTWDWLGIWSSYIGLMVAGQT